MTMPNMSGPAEQMSLADHPVKGFYLMVVGVPQVGKNYGNSAHFLNECYAILTRRKRWAKLLRRYMFQRSKS
ncbi:hypothetical protein ACET3Z_002889 [Daucus carota]